MKRFPIIVLLCFLINLLQSAVFSRITLFGVTADIVIVFLVCFSLIGDSIGCLVAALAAGVMRDSLFPAVFGVNSLLYIIAAYLLFFIQRRIYRDSIIIPVFFTFIITCIKGLTYYLIFYSMEYTFSFSLYASNIILVEALLNSFIAIFIFKFLLWLSSKEIFKQDWKF